jgi:hypothetical protein
MHPELVIIAMADLRPVQGLRYVLIATLLIALWIQGEKIIYPRARALDAIPEPQSSELEPIRGRILALMG